MSAIPREIELEIKNIARQLVEKYGAESVILFGGTAHGKWTKDSDLDFVVLKRNAPSRLTDRIYELDSMIEYHQACDFMVYTPEEFKKRLEMKDPFVLQISREGRVVYGGY